MRGVLASTLAPTLASMCGNPALCLPHFQSLSTAMKHLCEILTTDPEGGPARIPFETFAYVYRYLSRLDPEISVAETEVYLSSLKDSV